MEILFGIWNYVVPFVVVLTVLVYVHEMGHYLIARWCGVRIEVFSIGFGPEIYGITDSLGTRWKLSAIPFGGYVKMFGEHPPDPTAGQHGQQGSATDEAVSFYKKTVWQRMAIVFAGPFANFVFAVIVFAGLFSIVGQPHTPADIGEVMKGSAAERAGLKAGDVFLRIGSRKIERFQDVVQIVRFSAGRPLEIVVLRDGAEVALTAVPDVVEEKRFGNVQKVGRLGVGRSARDMVVVRHDPLTAVWRAVVHTYIVTGSILDAVGQIISGQRTAKELGGPLRIAQVSGNLAQAGLVMLIQFMAILSINLGLINLFPIPILDGGHLMFYVIEALRGKPLSERAMGFSLNIGLAFILGITLLVTWNDLVQLKVVEYFIELVT